ncbi:MAG: putative metal-dependent hydrolase [Cytophagaceae bacterium]|nr:putative metal-dependent hydrolase [Cytophagaceae bacterium]MBL0303997.1 putative metal-dependent hydrolase [Cytophagaceae bacterium]MBL0326810.1 putative metal-dependent hydrolase [Cytophagaceae bacterium]
MEELKYPIGKFDATKEYDYDSALAALDYLKDFPKTLRGITANMTEKQLDTAYRPEGWTARQVVHHIADSHANMYIRVKLALTEENPTIKGYNEAEWAKLMDSKLPIEDSLLIIEGLHNRLFHLLKNESPEVFEKTFYHNGYQRTYILKNVLNLYKWHSQHHLEHIKIAIKNA